MLEQLHHFPKQKVPEIVTERISPGSFKTEIYKIGYGLLVSAVGPADITVRFNATPTVTTVRLESTVTCSRSG